MAVAVNADAIQGYESGIFNGLCSTEVNHAVLVVGYGTDSTDGDYWIIKNSWDTTWGEQGYYRMAMGKGLCGINRLACYPNSGYYIVQSSVFTFLGLIIVGVRNVFLC